MKSIGLKVFMLSIILVVSLTTPVLRIFPCTFAQMNQQDSLLKSLTLPLAIQIALNENPVIKAAHFQVDASVAQLTQARSGFFPQVFISEAFNHTNNPMWAFGTKLNQEVISQADFNPDKLNDPDAINNFTTAVTMDWTLFDPVRTWFPWQQSRQNLKASEYMLDRTRQEVIARTITAYTGVLLAEEHLNVVRQSLNTALSHLKLVRDRYENGFIVKSDFLRMQVRVGELEQHLIESESNSEIARVNLTATMGLPVERRFDLTSSFYQESDNHKWEIQGSVEKWVETALSHRPDLETLRYQEKIAEKEIQKSKFAHLPSIHIIGNYEMNSENFNDMAENYTLGAVAQLNLFSGNRLGAGTKEAKAALARVKTLITAMENSIHVEIRQAFYQTQSAGKRIQVAKTAVIQADEGLRIAKNRYENGLLTLVELLDAQVAQQQACMNYAGALHDYKTATAQLALASGTMNADFK